MHTNLNTLLVITNQYPPENIVGALRPFRLVKHIARKGWRVKVITYMPNARVALDYNLLDELSYGTEIHYINKSRGPFIAKQSNRDYFSALKEKKKSLNGYNKFIKRLHGIGKELINRAFIPDAETIKAPLFINKARKCINGAHNQVAITTSPPHSIHLAGLFLSKIYKIPWIADFRDPWDYYPKTGSIQISNPIEKKLEYYVLNNANAIISSTKTYTNNLIKKYPHINKDKFFTITNCFDPEKVSVINNQPKDKFIISYTGIFYPQKDPFTFFRALRTWLDRSEKSKREWIENNLVVQLIGSKSKPVEDIIHSLKLSRLVRFIERVAHYQAIRMTKASDLLLICTGIGRQTREGWLPSKLFEYLGCKIPILAVTREGELAHVIRETNSGYVVSSEDHQTIISILENEMNKKYVANDFQNQFSFSFHGIERFEESCVMGEMIRIIEKASGIF